MTGTLTHITRHPLKAVGRELLDTVTLTPGECLPWDRVWAVLHDRAQTLDGTWAKKANFLRGVTEPQLMAVTSTFDGSTLTLDHPSAGQLALNPDDDGEAPRLLDWLAAIWPADLPAPTGIYRADVPLTDVPDPWISINNLSSHRAVQDRAGQDLSIHRWRGNLWIDGLAPWEEFDWIGKEISIGPARLEVAEPITRCKATMANPDTGKRDVDTLALLRSWNHQEFGVYARVIEGGDISVGDTAGR